MKAKQAKLALDSWTKDRFAFGGSLLKGSHPKKKRPFTKKLPMHIVLKSSKATGKHSLLKHHGAIALLIAQQAKRQHLKVYSVSNAGNHIHLLVQAPSRQYFQAFLRGINARISQLVMGEDKEKRSEAFWDARPFSRIVSWGKAFQNVRRYLSLNSAEALPEMMSSSKQSRRGLTRSMFNEITELIKSGALKANPSLTAAGFG